MSSQERRTLLGWLVANPIIILTIATAAFYAAVRYGQQKFYSRLGLTPEDVGHNRIDTLAQATGLAVDLLFLLAVMVGIPMVGYWVYRRIESQSPFPQSRFASAMWFAAILFIIAGTVFFTLVWFHDQATWAADRVETGRPVRMSFLADTGIHAEKAKITWIGAAPAGLTDLPIHRLMYLGQSGGDVVLYDVDDDRSLRMPSSKVAVSIVR
jgi:hypothetical protein